MIDFTCPKCSAQFQVADQDIGRSGQCKACEGTITLLPTVTTEVAPSECYQYTELTIPESRRWFQFGIWQIGVLTAFTALVIATCRYVFDDQMSRWTVSVSLVIFFVYLLLIGPVVRNRRRDARLRLQKINEYRSGTCSNSNPIER